ncbi:nucleotidyltransferase domain-containing protein [Tardiphaga sp. 20_F10_N6_6]|jgi:hypothetical protein|uniref:nucleotidyltransferase domain-containing protein n=1 Tax=Tardiphaga sp. 20_F10_N6_6 TaxID=3240788 RepID=UPI003F889BCE
MTMHIYAFGSVCRGDISPASDIDLLAIVDGYDERFNPNDYSVYSYNRIEQIWKEGNPFAWHLATESKLLFTSEKSDFLRSLHEPARYKRAAQDCQKFFSLFKQAQLSIKAASTTATFDLSMVFLAIRNFATCFSLGFLDHPDFSRRSAIRLGRHSLAIEPNAFEILERARILCTRAIGPPITASEASVAAEQFPRIEAWMELHLRKVEKND